jgi:hypothetical protein
MSTEAQRRLEGFRFTDRRGVKQKPCSPKQQRELYRLERADPAVAAAFEEWLTERSGWPRSIYGATGLEASHMIRFYEDSRL